MSASDAVARMLTLIPWLIERPGASIAETASAFGVDEATIRTDLGHLDFCGLPGLGGGALFDVSIVEDRVVVQMADELRRPLRPTAGEALRLVLLVDAAARVLGDEVPALASAVDKLRRALGVPEHIADVLQAETPDDVATLRGAIRARVRVRFDYVKRGSPALESRHVEPWAVRLIEGAWYLHAHDLDRREARSFRLDRASAITPLTEPATEPVPDDFEAPRYLPGEHDTVVTLELAPGGRWLLDAVVPDTVEEVADGAARVTLRTDAPDWLARLVIMAGGRARVVSPPEVARAVADRSRLALAALTAGWPRDAAE